VTRKTRWILRAVSLPLTLPFLLGAGIAWCLTKVVDAWFGDHGEEPDGGR